MRRPYTKAEVQFIRQNYKSHADLPRIIAHLQRTKGAVQQKISELGIGIPCKIKFTKADCDFLRQHYMRLTNAQLAAALGKKKTVVRKKMYKMKLQRVRYSPWSEREDAVIRQHYQTAGDTAIARLLPGRGRKSVMKRRKRIGLHRSVEQIRAIVQRNMPRLLATAFRPGEQRYKPDMRNAWATRRANECLTPEQIIERIQIRERTNFYR